MTVCFGLFRQYRNIFAKARRTCRTCSKALVLLTDEYVRLCLKKCKFFTNCIDYLGHAIRPGPLEVSTTTTYPLCRLVHPTNLTKLQSLFGLCNVLWRLVPNFPDVAASLKTKFRKGQLQTFDWLSNEEITAWETIRARPIEFPVAALPGL